MRYEVRNIYFGTRMIMPSEAALKNFLSTCKKDKKLNKPVWEVSKELPDEEPRPQKFTKEELQAMLAEYDEVEEPKKRGRKPKDTVELDKEQE